ncbi:hypothetical protein [Clostridium sp. C105KSO13]|uniref:hypothetical protein n=1 Tax=Clostridium sp. C105KSO13 TaxID=1776045 RepID=UPI000B7EF5D8|nr:hypothetical protein [Clostridium sp. C105KSO13]
MQTVVKAYLALCASEMQHLSNGPHQNLGLPTTLSTTVFHVIVILTHFPQNAQNKKHYSTLIVNNYQLCYNTSNPF